MSPLYEIISRISLSYTAEIFRKEHHQKWYYATRHITAGFLQHNHNTNVWSVCIFLKKFMVRLLETSMIKIIGDNINQSQDICDLRYCKLIFLHSKCQPQPVTWYSLKPWPALIPWSWDWHSFSLGWRGLWWLVRQLTIYVSQFTRTHYECNSIWGKRRVSRYN